MRSGAFAPDFPFVILVVASGDCLRIPSGLSTPRLPQTQTAPGSIGFIFTGAGAICVLGVLANGGVWRKILRGPPPAGRAGGLWGLTRRLASGDSAARWWLACVSLTTLRAGGDVPRMPATLHAYGTSHACSQRRMPMLTSRACSQRRMPMLTSHACSQRCAQLPPPRAHGAHVGWVKCVRAYPRATVHIARNPSSPRCKQPSKTKTDRHRRRVTQDIAYAPKGRPRGRPGAGPARSSAIPRRWRERQAHESSQRP